jgi:tetratricopeptide (TPR) repeat protein
LDTSKRLNLSSFGIDNRLQLIEKRIEALTTILNGNVTFSDSWNDLALCLADKFRFTNDESVFDKAEQFLKKAILLPSSAQKRSNYWFNLGVLQSTRLRLSKACHCFIRAIQLNEQNAKAWYALSLVYKKSGKVDLTFIGNI